MNEQPNLQQFVDHLSSYSDESAQGGTGGHSALPRGWTSMLGWAPRRVRPRAARGSPFGA